MQTKNETGSGDWVDPDDAPELTKDMLEDAEYYHGNTFIRRGPPGRPKSDSSKELVSLRLDQDVLAYLRSSGPGWQTRVNGLLRELMAGGDALQRTASVATESVATEVVREVSPKPTVGKRDRYLASTPKREGASRRSPANRSDTPSATAPTGRK